MASSTGLCRYGARVDCCWGWTRQSWGHCQPVCQPGCKHGECVGPNKCKCHAGFTGKTCNQDLNECGLKPRPCKHRCMNTYGSYKCYCLNGYMLMPDGSCGNARTCGMANCQYGCEVLKGEVRCQCPSPGLQLALDGRTCVDVDECAAGTAVCPRFRKCINTFGSYICKCHDGFDLQYINGKYQCIDVDECSLGHSQCSSVAACYNTPGSYKCKCKEGYRGMGHDCKRKWGGGRTTTTTTVRPLITEKRVFIPRTTRPTTTTTTTTSTTTEAPPKRVTPPRKPAVPTKRPLVPTRKPSLPTRKPYVPPKPAPPPTRRPYIPPLPAPVTPVDNSINKEVTKQRGDVHIPRNHGHNAVLGIDFDIELGNTADERLCDSPLRSGLPRCSFDDGLCGWIRDKDGDVHWETTPDPSGGRYLTIPEVGNKRTGRGHKLAGHHVGMLQVFVKKGKQYSPAVWGRTGGNGWRHTQITLWGTGLESVTWARTEGEMAVDDITLRKGSCTEEHNLRRL
uniref:Nephronectin a n=1 Tax=Neogobius melanostomus TaxID=47308 RepID=A0A8C6T746_9GOBI